MNTQVRLQIQQASAQLFGSKQLFFDPVTLTITQPLTFIAGKNGVGKSTFLKIISGDHEQFNALLGSIILDGVEYQLSDVASCDQLYAKSMNVRQQSDEMLAKNCTGAENITGARMSFFPSLRMFYTYQLPELAKLFDIPLNIPVFRLSGGQRQMLTLLMAVQKPVQLLLLDEPTAALDEKNADLVMKFLQQLIEMYGVTVLCITHDMSLMKQYGGNAYIYIKEDQGKRSVALRSF